MEYDLHSKVGVAVALDQQTIATDTTTDGNVIDMAGTLTNVFESLEYVIFTGTVTDGTYTLLLEESDVVTFGGEETAVPAAEQLGDAVSIVAADDDAVFRRGSIGKMQFQRLAIVSAGTTVGAVVGAIAILSDPHFMPVAEQAT